MSLEEDPVEKDLMDRLEKEISSQEQLALDSRREWSTGINTIAFRLELEKRRAEIYKWLETNFSTTEGLIRFRLGECNALTRTINLIQYGRYEHK